MTINTKIKYILIPVLIFTHLHLIILFNDLIRACPLLLSLLISSNRYSRQSFLQFLVLNSGMAVRLIQ